MKFSFCKAMNIFQLFWGLVASRDDTWGYHPQLGPQIQEEPQKCSLPYILNFFGGLCLTQNKLCFPNLYHIPLEVKIQFRDCRLSRSRADKGHCSQSGATMYPIVLGSQMGRYQHTKDLPHIINIGQSFGSRVGGLLQSHMFGPSPLFHSSMQKQTSITTSFVLTFSCRYNL